MITIRNLTVCYSKNRPTLDALNLEVGEHSIHGLVGLNGAGKTTLFNAIFGLKDRDGGEVLFDGQPLTKRDIAYLPTDQFFYSGITGREYLQLFRNGDFDETKWMELFKVPADRMIDCYSTGMKKKLALLGVVKLDRPVMILDEPFNGLDIEACHLLKLALLRLRDAGKTILVSSHILESLTAMCDIIHYLDAGKIKLSCTKSDFARMEREIASIVEHENTTLIDACFTCPV
jgi:ABC-2 type transport system ATP-binding protein